MNKEQKQIMKKVNQAYSKLYFLSNITWTPYREELFKIEKENEKKHRSGTWYEFHDNYASVSDCAKMFVVKNIAEFLTYGCKYTIKDILKIRKGCILAQSVVENYQDKILEHWKDEDLNYLANIDYVSLVDWNLYQKTLERKSA